MLAWTTPQYVRYNAKVGGRKMQVEALRPFLFGHLHIKLQLGSSCDIYHG